MMFYFAAFLIFCVGVVHSYLGERYLLIRLFRKDDLPKLCGNTAFTKQTLRFAWHITTIAWFGLALVLLHLASGDIKKELIAYIISSTFFIHFAVALLASKGKHLSWIVFLLIFLFTFYGAKQLSI